MIKIKEICGYTLYYDDKRRQFIISDADGTELASSPTQDGAEEKAKALSKQDFKRIKIVRVSSDGRVSLGELTSLNKDDYSAWVSMASSTFGSGRQKLNLGYSHDYYERTEANLIVIEAIQQKRAVVDEILEEIKELVVTLEKRINREYFGLKDRY